MTQGTVQRSRTDSGQGQRMDGKLRHKCQWQLQQPHHGQRLQAAVRCRNPVQLVASATSAYAVVELKAPDVSQVTDLTLSQSVSSMMMLMMIAMMMAMMMVIMNTMMP